MQGMLAVDRGSLVAGREHLETARSLGAQIFDGRINGLLARGLAELALWEGRPDQALAEVSAGIERTNDDEMLARLAWLGLRAGADLAEEQRGEGHPVPDAVEDLTARLEPLLSRLEARAIGRRAPEASETRAAVASGRAERARLEGRADPERWRDVERRWRRLGYPAPAAYAGWRLAGALLAGGRRADAIGPWREAHREAVRLGADSLRAAIADEAARAFVPLLDDHSPSGSGDAGGEVRPYNLTPRELEVLTLVAAGRTNRQIGEELFISEKTASVHVSRILVKLDVTSRAQAAALAGRLGLTGSAGPAAGH
jgi:DNA-binding CsgD family transcriptional regulator